MIWLTKRRGSCGGFQEELRSLVEETPAALETRALLERGGRELREHLAACPACDEQLRDALAGRKLLREAFVPAVVPEVFAARVMAQIRSRESQWAAAHPWAALQTLASRVAWVSALILLIASTWVYQHNAPSPNSNAATETAADRFPEPTPQPSDLNEVLISLAETQP
jgi:anti-sigma factor RsiW